MATTTRRAEEPEYRRLANALRQDVDQHRWGEGDPLPTDAALEASTR